VLSLVTGKVGRDAEFQRLVDSIIRHTTVEWELVVSDASPAPYVSALPNIRVFHENPRQTHSIGYNKAFRASIGKWCLWLNDDAEVCHDYDTEAITFMERHPHIGLGALHYSECGGPFHVNSAWSTIYANFGILPRWLGDRVGFFDEGVSMYGSDNSLALRILLADFGVADIPKARIIHHSTKDQTRIDNQATRARDNKYMQSAYMPVKRHWVAAYRKHYVPSGVVPWSHGIQPELVTA
jgi:GT2 family glycosyltransferase